MAELIVTKEGKELSRIQIGAKAVSIGRDAASDIVLDSQKVSRTHCRVNAAGSGWTAEDCQSTHGTKINGEKLSRQALNDDDRIGVGEFVIRFHAQNGRPLVSAEPAPKPSPGAADPYATQLRSVLLHPQAGEKEVARLQALFEISRSLGAAQDFEVVLEEILDKSIKVMGAERGIIMLKDQENGELRVHVARDRSGRVEASEADSISRSIVRKVVATGEPVLIEDAQSALSNTASIMVHSIHSVLCTPLKNRDEVTGVIYVDDRTRKTAFTHQDMVFFATFATQAQSAIDNSRSYWQLIDSLFQASADLILVCGADGKVNRANQGAAVFSGRPVAELASQPVVGLFCPEHREKAEALVRDTLEKGVLSGVELDLVSVDAGRVPLSVSSFALRDRDGTPVGLCLIGRDLSELRGLISKLTELNDMKSQFVGMVSHELKGRLAVNIGFFELMLNDKENPIQPAHREFVERLHDQNEEVARLIADLLDLTQIETGKVPLRLSNVDLNSLMSEAVTHFELQLRDRRVAPEVSLSPQPAEIEGDEVMLRHVVQNLVSNGIKYNKEGGRLRLAVEDSPSGYRLTFSDEGVGISEADMPKLFQRFFRANAVRKIPGTGLGLSIVQAIAERHGGRVSVESVLGKGTTFHVKLPRSSPPA